MSKQAVKPVKKLVRKSNPAREFRAAFQKLAVIGLQTIPVNIELDPQTWFDLHLIAHGEKITIDEVISGLVFDSTEICERADVVRNA